MARNINIPFGKKENPSKKKKKKILMMISNEGLKKKQFLAWSCDRGCTGLGMV